MLKVKKQTPVTIENISKLLDDRFGKFEKRSDSRLNNRFDKFEKHFDSKIEELVTTNDLYEKTNKRTNRIDKHLGIDTSTVF